MAYFRFHVNAIAAFWIAYVLTRPLGASIVDYLGVPPDRGGLDLGAGPVTWVSTTIIVALVTYMAVAHRRALRAQLASSEQDVLLGTDR